MYKATRRSSLRRTSCTVKCCLYVLSFGVLYDETLFALHLLLFIVNIDYHLVRRSYELAGPQVLNFMHSEGFAISVIGERYLSKLFYGCHRSTLAYYISPKAPTLPSAVADILLALRPICDVGGSIIVGSSLNSADS